MTNTNPAQPHTPTADELTEFWTGVEVLRTAYSDPARGHHLRVRHDPSISGWWAWQCSCHPDHRGMTQCYADACSDAAWHWRSATFRDAVRGLIDRHNSLHRALGRARQLHRRTRFDGYPYDVCAICEYEWPCPTIRALDDQEDS